MDLEVQENKILNILLILFAISLGLSYIFFIPVILATLVYFLYNRLNYKYFYNYRYLILFLIFNMLLCFYFKNNLGIYSNIAIIFLFYVLNTISYLNKENIYIIMDKVVMSTAVYAIVEFVIFLFKHERIGYLGYFNPNYYATFLMFLIIFLLYNFKNKKDFIFLAIFLVSLFQTGSRTSIISTIIGIFLVIYFKYNKILGSFLILSSIFYIFGIKYLSFPFIRSDSIDKYFKLRLWIWELSKRAIKANVFGYGPLYFFKYTNYIYPHSHNVFLETIVSYGIFAYLFIFYYIKKYIKTNFQIILLIILLINGLADYTIFWVQNATLFLLLNIYFKCDNINYKCNK